jgi:wyosine [tRNA(Phe)-imidazoG37] synthetase (radical SAM superfamily)
MSTVIYSSPIFGPIHSRRLGVSLGVNLMPGDGKVCTFDCIYCECGFNADHRPTRRRPTREEVCKALERQLNKMKKNGEKPDVITFAGNGEPTAHPDFLGIIEDTLVLRNLYFPEAKVAVLSNATLIARENVFKGLMLVDDNILKLDTVNDNYIQHINRPLLYYSAKDQINQMKRFRGHIMIQTMFMKGTYEGEDVSNVSDEYVKPWLDAIRKIKPQRVMVYTIDRETPATELQKATPEELDAIVAKVRAAGFEAEASY